MVSAYDYLKDFIPACNCLKQRDNGDFLIVLNKDGELYYLNTTAKYIYSLFDRTRSISDIFHMLEEKYEAFGEDDKKTIRHDLVDLIRSFQWQRIVQLMEK